MPANCASAGACVGAGIDLITACDLRYATQDARLSVKEVRREGRAAHATGWE